MKKYLKRGKMLIVPKRKFSSFSLIMIILMFILLLVLSYLVSSYNVASNCITTRVQLSPGFGPSAMLSITFIAFAVLGLGGWIYAAKKQQ